MMNVRGESKPVKTDSLNLERVMEKHLLRAKKANEQHRGKRLLSGSSVL